MRVLLVDDDSTRYDQFKMNNPSIHFTFVTTSSDAIKVFDANNYDVICLDHDLGDNDTTIPFVKFIRNFIDDSGISYPFFILVHSANPIGSANILSYFSRSSVVCNRIHFAWTIPNLFTTLFGDSNESR